MPSYWQLAAASAACTAAQASSSGKQVKILLRLVGLAFFMLRTIHSWRLVSGLPKLVNSYKVPKPARKDAINLVT